MKVILLGTGTSQGIPVIGCECETCTSTDNRDKRLRTSVLIEVDGRSILIDTSPDIRQQMLVNKIERLDAVLYTHEHNDHTVGFDDIRPFNFKQKEDIPIFGLERVINQVRRIFSYAFIENPYPGAPRATCHFLDGLSTFNVKGVEIIPINVMHGSLPILGYRIQDFTFITDASYLSPASIDKIKGSKVLVINALQEHQHYSHFTLSQALEVIQEVNPERAYITHLSHLMGPTHKWETRLPNDVFPAFDGLVIKL